MASLGLSPAPEAWQVGFLLNAPQAGSGECLSVWHKEEKNEALIKREDICRVGQSHNPVVILREKLGSSVWLGKPPPCSWFFSLLLRPVSGKGGFSSPAWEKGRRKV